MVIQNRILLDLLRVWGRQDWIRYGVRDRTLRFFYGAYEKQELYLLRDLVAGRSDPVFVDIGANVGQHSLFMSRYCKQVHAFEPYEPVLTSLTDKIGDNQIRNIQVHALAIGEKDEWLDFFAPHGPNRGTGSFSASHATDNNERIGQLRVVNGDSYFERLGLERVDLIKIDVEGFEKSVLKGLNRTLRTSRPSLFVEFSEETRRSFTGRDELIGLLPADYAIYGVATNKDVAVVLNRAAYRLTTFNFEAPGGNILLQPAERGDSLNRLDYAARLTSFST